MGLQRKKKIAALIVCTSVVLTQQELRARRKKRAPSMRVNPYLIEREEKGRFVKDFEDLKKHKQSFYENFHMDAEAFEEIFLMVEPHLTPKRFTRPDIICAKQKFAVVMEYLASGSLQRHMASIYRISKQHLRTIIDQVCEAITEVLKCEVPSMNQDQFVKWSDEFDSKWQFPNCIGAIDGKHCALKAPKNSGSIFYNYKGFHSIVLMAVADASYKFTYLDIGAYGSEGDANVFSSSKFGQNVANDMLDFPEDNEIDGDKVPYLFLADDAFPICKRILKPYGGKQNLTDEERIFNYRLSRARRCVENAFGILCWKWLCLKRTMFCTPDRAQKIITTCCLLHNYFITKRQNTYCPTSLADRVDAEGKLVEGEWRENVSKDSLYHNDIPAMRGRQSQCGKNIRGILTRYFNSPAGSVSWQRTAAYLK